jgi:hypothetical protein
MEYWSVEKDLNPLSITPTLHYSKPTELFNNGTSRKDYIFLGDSSS